MGIRQSTREGGRGVGETEENGSERKEGEREGRKGRKRGRQRSRDMLRAGREYFPFREQGRGCRLALWRLHLGEGQDMR